MTATSTTKESNRSHSVADPSELREQVSVLGQDVKELARLTKEALGNRVESVKDLTTEAVGRGRDKALEYRDQVAGLTRENPLKSLLIAAGVGALLSVLLRRR